ncbi:tetratricopeptide repeat protein [Flavobacterium cutihirudinis]|uniref:histidine kinase n=2 Tax=Flavobacterium cutihirudinis TaxID=1265740 RepID=A0A3D9FX46_9FLAO|nr:tetratricopeptide repeat protein [Flavobacterium cutihirudinis]
MNLKINKILFCFLFILPFFLYSQSKEINLFEKKILQEKAVQFNGENNFVKAQSFYLKKDWDSTLVYSMKQLSVSENKNLSDYCHYFRGQCFFNKKFYKEAQNELSLISEKFELSHMKNFVLGVTHLETKKLNKALEYFQLAEKQSITVKDLKYLSNIYSGLGTTYIFLKQYSLAEKYLLKNISLCEKYQNNDKTSNAYTNLAALYYELYKDDLAIFYYTKSYNLSQKSKDFKLKNLTSFNMSIVEENRGNLKKALEYRKEADQWKDSANNQNKIWAIAELEKKFAVAQKQKQIKVLKVENQLKNNQRNGLFVSAIVLLLLLTSGVYFYAQKVKNAKTILIQRNKLDQLNNHKDQLFSIVSHDLRSSVNALKTSNSKLSDSLQTKNYEQLNQLITQNSSIANDTYSLLDNLLHWAMLQTKQLYFHKESVHLYSIVQQIEYNYKSLLQEKEIRFENLVPKNIFLFVDLDSLKIIFRNLLDNAIKFSKQNGEIRFYTAEVNSEFLQIIIEDSGIGMSENTISELLQDSETLVKKNNSEIIGTGLGLQLCKQMTAKNGGTFSIESEINKGTKIILTLPKIK